MMAQDNSVDVIVSLPKFLMDEINEDIKNEAYDSASDVITFLLRSYYSTIGRFLQ